MNPTVGMALIWIIVIVTTWMGATVITSMIKVMMMDGIHSLTFAAVTIYVQVYCIEGMRGALQKLAEEIRQHGKH